MYQSASSQLTEDTLVLGRKKKKGIYSLTNYRCTTECREPQEENLGLAVTRLSPKETKGNVSGSQKKQQVCRTGFLLRSVTSLSSKSAGKDALSQRQK